MGSRLVPLTVIAARGASAKHRTAKLHYHSFLEAWLGLGLVVRLLCKAMLEGILMLGPQVPLPVPSLQMIEERHFKAAQKNEDQSCRSMISQRIFCGLHWMAAMLVLQMGSGEPLLQR